MPDAAFSSLPACMPDAGKCINARALSTGARFNDGVQKPAHPFKGVIFGLWGVVASPTWSQHEAWEAVKSIPIGTFQRFADKPAGAMRKMLDGVVGTTQGGALLHSELAADGIDVQGLTPKDLTEQMRHVFGTGRINGDVRDAVQCLRFDGFQTGLLCREWHMGEASAQKQKRSSRSEMKKQFNAIVESKSEQLPLLNPALYTLVCKRAGLLPRETIYVDSCPDALLPAKEIGMTTVLCKTGADGVKQIESLMDLPLTNFAWSRDVYAKVLWVSNKDCQTTDA